MKKINILLVLVLALGFLAFGPQGSAFAEGTVPNPSAQDSSSCAGGKLQIGTAMAYVNGESSSNCASFLQKATVYPAAPGDLKPLGTPVLITFSKDVLPLVTVCFPTKPAEVAGQIFRMVGDPAYWLQLPTYEDGNMTCAIASGGGTFGYFGH